MSDRAYDRIVYHAGCPDGWCAAWVAERHGSPGAELVPAAHGDAPPDGTGERVLVVDFSYPAAALKELAARAARLTVLDHHASRRDAVLALAGLGAPTVTAVHDPGKAGCRLAWEHCRPGEDAPEVVRYVEDRDLWRWALKKSREVSAAIASHGHDLGTWDWLADRCATRAGRGWLALDGTAILRYQRQVIARHVRAARPVLIGGHLVPAVNATALASEVCEALLADCPAAPFAACWRDAGGERHWSLRGRPGGVDVGEVAARLGGGGHPTASGFRSPRAGDFGTPGD